MKLHGLDYSANGHTARLTLGPEELGELEELGERSGQRNARILFRDALARVKASDEVTAALSNFSTNDVEQLANLMPCQRDRQLLQSLFRAELERRRRGKKT